MIKLVLFSDTLLIILEHTKHTKKLASGHILKMEKKIVNNECMTHCLIYRTHIFFLASRHKVSAQHQNQLGNAK